MAVPLARSYISAFLSMARSWLRPRNTAPTTPALSMPRPPMEFRVSAPPRGKRSATTPIMVGQKKDLATPYSVAAARIAMPTWAFESQNRPTAAKAEQMATTPIMVGQKKDLATPYSVAAARIAMPTWAFESQNRPTAAKAEQMARRPSGVNFLMIGPAKKRRMTMITEV